MRHVSTYAFMAAVFAATLLAGCAVGPDFNRPAGPDVAGYTATPLAAHTAAASTTLGESQRFVEGGLVKPQWWRELGSRQLDKLIAEALQASPTLAAAEATLRQAQEVYAARAGSTLYPQVNANLSSQSQRFSPSASGQTGDARDFNLYNAGLGMHYTFDLAGGTSSDLESLATKVDYQRFKLEGAKLTLATSIVTTAITRANLTAQIQAMEAILGSQEKQLGVTQDRVRLGQAIPDDVLALQTQVEQTRASIPLLRNQLQQNEHLLAVLAGQAPGAGGLPFISLQEFKLPVDLPLAVPSELVRNRPDIQAAEAMLHAANADYGVAIAKLYPVRILVFKP